MLIEYFMNQYRRCFQELHRVFMSTTLLSVAAIRTVYLDMSLSSGATLLIYTVICYVSFYIKSSLLCPRICAGLLKYKPTVLPECQNTQDV